MTIQQMLLAAARPSINTTMTAGNSGNFRGFKSSVAPFIGSMTSPALTDGMTIVDFYDDLGSPDGILSISGFTSDPGQFYIDAATGNVTLRTVNAASYSYSAGVATWTWLSAFGFPTSGTANVIIS
jgi:hypothetical protein